MEFAAISFVFSLAIQLQVCLVALERVDVDNIVLHAPEQYHVACGKVSPVADLKQRKQKAGKAGFPEYTAVVGDFVLVMEDKADRANLCLKEADGTISMTVQATTDYAVNGALHYAQHILQKITYKKFLRSAMPVIASTILYSRYL